MLETKSDGTMTTETQPMKPDASMLSWQHYKFIMTETILVINSGGEGGANSLRSPRRETSCMALQFMSDPNSCSDDPSVRKTTIPAVTVLNAGEKHQGVCLTKSNTHPVTTAKGQCFCIAYTTC